MPTDDVVVGTFHDDLIGTLGDAHKHLPGSAPAG